jgi:RHS repeat-associated protein
MLDISLQNGDTIFDINNDGNSQAYYTSTIRPLMAPYYAQSDLATIDYYVNNYGERIIAPMHGNIAVGQWVGVGFKSLSNAYGYGEVISGGLNGGAGGTNDAASLLTVNTQEQLLVPSNSPYVNLYGPPGGGGTAGDPEDIRKGSFRHQHDDLMTGPNPFPYGLTFSRSYDSNAQSSTGPLGSGWTHNFAITATVGSDGYAGMGGSTPLSAVSSIVALYVGADLVKGLAEQGQTNLRQFVLEAVVNHWFTDYLTKNVVYVNQGWSNEEFTLLPDGTYAPQPGTAAILDAPGGNFRYRSKMGETLSFNASGKISSWITAAGAAVTYTYSGGLLSTVANAATGRQLTFTYSGSLISSVSDGTRTVSYGYTNGNLTTYTDALQQNTTYTYDTSGQQDTAGHLTQIFYPSHPANSFVTNYYDPLGRVVLQTDANGNLTQSFFAGSRSEMDDPVGNRHVWYIDPLGNITNDIDDYGPAPHLNLSTASTYDAQRNLLSLTMPEGNTTAYTYDARFNQLTITDTPKPGSPLAPRVASFTYTAPVASFPNFEEVQTSTDANRNVTSNSYDSSTGNLLKVTQPTVTKPGAGSSTPQTSFTYTAIGLPQTSQDAEGRVTLFQYDPAHADQVTSITVDSGRLNLKTQVGYDSFGDHNSVTDANGNTTTSTFDNLRRLQQSNGPISGVATSYTYYPDGQVKTMTRNATVPETTKYTYTLFDQLSVVTDPLGNTVTATYDADDRKQTVTTQVTAHQNRQRTYSYDALSRLYQISDTAAGTPGTVLESHTYSPNSNPLTFTDANANTTAFAYDGFDRLNQTTYPDKTTQNLQYDPNGNVTQTTARSGQTITFTYDGLNRKSTKTPAGEASGQATYGYDFTGRVLNASDQSGANAYQIGYDTAGRAISYTDQQGRNTQTQYDAVGNRTRLQWPANSNGANAYFVTYGYDALNRMTEIDANGSTSTPLAKYQFDTLSRQTLVTFGDGTADSYSQYDASDNLLALTDSFAGGSSVTFSYGWLGNHRRQSTAVSNTGFQYTPGSGAASYTADVDNSYTSVGATNLTYDGNHNLTYDGFNTLTYDVENRLIQAQNALSGTSQYLYDPLGRRKQKVVNGVATQFVLAGRDEVADYAGPGAGTAQTLYVRGLDATVAAAVTASTGGAVYYHRDGLGSTVALTQAGTSGAAETYTYGEFGTPSGGTSATYSFAGYRYDPETGLYYLHARGYSPQLGRFLQTDPIGFAGGRNLYAYAKNDPLSRTDPYGTHDAPQVSLAAMDPLGPGVAGLALWRARQQAAQEAARQLQAQAYQKSIQAAENTGQAVTEESTILSEEGSTIAKQGVEQGVKQVGKTLGQEALVNGEKQLAKTVLTEGTEVLAPEASTGIVFLLSQPETWVVIGGVLLAYYIFHH